MPASTISLDLVENAIDACSKPIHKYVYVPKFGPDSDPNLETCSISRSNFIWPFSRIRVDLLSYNSKTTDIRGKYDSIVFKFRQYFLPTATKTGQKLGALYCPRFRPYLGVYLGTNSNIVEQHLLGNLTRNSVHKSYPRLFR